MSNLKQLTIENVSTLLNEEDLKALNQKEQIFAVTEKIRMEEAKPDELLELEIALRKCERVGFFKN